MCTEVSGGRLLALKNQEYDAVMRRYDEIRTRHIHERDERTEEVYERIPGYADLDAETADESLKAAKLRISDPACALTEYRAAMERIGEQKAALLRAYGYPENYLELTYDCPICRDTGFTDGKHCSCFTRIAADVIYGNDSLKEVLREENFARFSFDLYSDTIKDEMTGQTPRELARGAFSAARLMADQIGSGGTNLYITGNTGVGKTFLSHCIAGEAVRRGLSVLYFSSGNLFDMLADTAFNRSGADGTASKLVTECDLLVIDDLGTELTNALVGSELFRIINERLAKKRATVISSNLSLGDLSVRYSERVFSRITCHYTLIRLAGNDIRIQKKLNGGLS